jgi:hypothetical protein
MLVPGSDESRPSLLDCSSASPVELWHPPASSRSFFRAAESLVLIQKALLSRLISCDDPSDSSNSHRSSVSSKVQMSFPSSVSSFAFSSCRIEASRLVETRSNADEEYMSGLAHFHIVKRGVSFR